ncbi:MAG: PAS domain-containing protein [Planctomycetes bacterium]|nr:PAS domain-containing protein [Planctomycetota bacterium]
MSPESLRSAPAGESPAPNPLGWVPAALLTWFAIFATYEVVERLLLRGTSEDVLHVLHIVRGTLTSFALAGVVAWSMLRRHAGVAPGPAADPRESAAGDLSAAARWIIRLRWVAIAGVVATALVCRYAFEVISGFSSFALVLIAACMAICNARFSTLSDRHLAGFRIAFSQVFLDLAALTFMLYFAGGAGNPFFLFYLFHIVIAGILLSKSETWLVCAAACALFGGMILVRSVGSVPRYPLLLGGVPAAPPGGWMGVAGTFVAFVATAACTAYFSARIMDNLRTRSRALLRANEALATERAKLENLVRSIGAGLVIYDCHDRVIWANDVSRSWFGEDLQGKVCPGRLWGDGCMSCPRAPAVGGVPAGTCERAVVRGGRQRFFLVNCTPIRSSGGEVDQVLELIQDITHLREMEVQLVQADKMVAVGQLAAGIAHEINNPLATMSSSSEILAEVLAGGETGTEKGKEALKRHLGRIEENVERCKDIVQNLLSFARRDEEGYEEVDLDAVLDDAVRLVEAGAQARGRRIVRETAAAGGARTVLARSRGRQIQQVALNLLMNALDATAPGGTVRLAARPLDGGAEFSVADDGEGIRPEHMARLFQPFFTTKPPGKGTGLGLHLSHRIVEALGGRIRAESPAGAGATFRVWLPSDSARGASRSPVPASGGAAP